MFAAGKTAGELTPALGEHREDRAAELVVLLESIPRAAA
jgi:hypothetical protein